MALNKEERQKLDEAHDSIIRIETILGNGDEGLCYDVHCLSASHYKLKRNFYVLISFLTGSGVLGGGLWALFAG